MYARLRDQKNLLIERDFPCFADEIAEPRPDMNIKVAAFTIAWQEKKRSSMLVHMYI